MNDFCYSWNDLVQYIEHALHNPRSLGCTLENIAIHENQKLDDKINNYNFKVGYTFYIFNILHKGIFSKRAFWFWYCPFLYFSSPRPDCRWNYRSLFSDRLRLFDPECKRTWFHSGWLFRTMPLSKQCFPGWFTYQIWSDPDRLLNSVRMSGTRLRWCRNNACYCVFEWQLCWHEYPYRNFSGYLSHGYTQL